MRHNLTVRALIALLSLGLAISANGFTYTRDKHSTAVPPGKARIIVTEQLGLLKVDENKYDRYAFNTGDTIVDLVPGPHALSVRYDWLWEYDYDNFDPLKSDPVIVALQAEAGKTYKITHRDLPDYKTALDFSRKPEVLVIAVNSGTLLSQPVPRAETVKPARPANPAPSSDQATDAADVASSAVAAAPASTQLVINQPSSLPMLQYWWNQASPAEQKQFRDWIQRR